MPPPAAAGLFKFKRVVWATAFAAVTIVGTMYGANLKTERQVDSVRPTRSLFPQLGLVG